MRGRWIAAAAFVAAAPMSDPASAASVALVRDGNTLVVYESRPGGDRITVRSSARTVVIRGERITAGAGCEGRYTVRCPIPEAGRRLRFDLGAGADRLGILSESPSTVRGGPGRDRITTGRGDDYVDGGEGGDTISGGRGNDTLLGGAGADRLHGYAGHDRLFGGLDADHLLGGTEDDRLNPGQGADFVTGGSGNDRIRARDTPPVYDRLDCGKGRDRVISRDRADHRGTACERR